MAVLPFLGLSKEVFQIVEKFLPFGGLIHASVQLAQEVFLLLCQSGGSLYHHREALVAPAAGVAHLGNALFPQDEFPTGLGAFGNLIIHLAVSVGT